MTQPIPSETLGYERYVARLRWANVQMLNALKSAQEFIDHAAVLMNTENLGKFEEIFGAGVLASYQQQVESALALAGDAPGTSLPKTITIHVEGGLVQDVTGIPAGYELRVEDYDHYGDRGPDWDAEKGCHVTVYAGEVS